MIFVACGGRANGEQGKGIQTTQEGRVVHSFRSASNVVSFLRVVCGVVQGVWVGPLLPLMVVYKGFGKKSVNDYYELLSC